ncbi:MAG: MGH1-like glycoside hydrolase domain-containing protein [Lutibacter sp.]
MKKSSYYILYILLVAFVQPAMSQNNDWHKFIKPIEEYVTKDYKKMYREAGGNIKHPFLVPGMAYSDQLWDWDSYYASIAIRQILTNKKDKKELEIFEQYEKGCVLNFLDKTSIDGWIPIVIQKGEITGELMSGFKKPKDLYSENMHKPMLAQQTAYLLKTYKDTDWLKEEFSKLQFFIGNYITYRRNEATGLYVWTTDHYIGVDNDPSTFFRPPGSSASIYLNSFMYKELLAMVYLADKLGYSERVTYYKKEADNLLQAIQEHCWDERDESFYSVDVNLMPVEKDKWVLHSGSPREYDCLIQRIDYWTNFLPLWAGIATPEQAKVIVEKHLLDENRFNAPYGIRTLSKMEKMYNLKASGNPSNWQGPIWGISNYLVWRGLVNYGFDEEAKEIAIKTIVLFGKDLEESNTLHEYYDPETGKPILHPEFQNWNFLVLNMIAWLEGGEVVSGF